MYTSEEIELASRFLGMKEAELKEQDDSDLSIAYQLIYRMDQGNYDRETILEIRERFNRIYPNRRLKNGCLSCLKGQIVYSESLLHKELMKRKKLMERSQDAVKTS